MGLFATSASPLDPHIDRATSDKNTSDDWSVILDVCDRVKEYSEGPKDCVKGLTKKLANDNPRVALQAVTLLDACVNNCGRNFLLEVASREFEQELRKIITSHRTHSKVSEKLRKCLKTWAEGEFKNDRQLSLIPALYSKLRQEGYEFDVASDSPKKKKTEYSNDPNVVNNKQEEDDIAQAIQLSLQTAKATSNYGSVSNGGGGSSNSNRSLYPSDLARDLDVGLSLSDSKGPASNASAPAAQATSSEQIKKARALYDFEAVEDNELTFQAGELIVVIDSSDPNWWKGSNHRGEGLFPANFVTLDIHGDGDHQPSRNEKRVSFSECVKVTEVVGGGEEEEQQEGGDGPADACAVEEATGEVDEEKIDYLMHMLHEADPTGERPDDPQLPSIEKQVAAMAPTIDAELEQIDRKHNELTRLNADLITGLNLYHQLMREMPVTSMGYYPSPVPYGAPMPHAMDPATGQMMPPHQVPGYSPYGSMPVMGCPPMGPYPPMGMPLPPHMGAPGMGPGQMAQSGPPSHNGIGGPSAMTVASSVAGGGLMSLPPPQQPPVSSMAPNGSIGVPVPSSQGAQLYHQTQASMPCQDHMSESTSNTCVSSSNVGVLPSYGHYPPVSDLQQHPPPQPLHQQQQQQQPQFAAPPPQQQQPQYHMMSPQHQPMMYGHPYSGSPVPHSMSPAMSVAPPPQQAYQQPLL